MLGPIFIYLMTIGIEVNDGKLLIIANTTLVLSSIIHSNFKNDLPSDMTQKWFNQRIGLFYFVF